MDTPAAEVDIDADLVRELLRQQHPDLATTFTYGQSWLKSKGKAGYDLKGICITKKQAGDCALNPTRPSPGSS